MKALQWFGRLLLLALGLVVAGNVVAPAVARAQFAASGGATVGVVLAALVGQDVTAARFVASASSDTGYKCNAALTDCVDLGPGANNSIGTDGSGKVILGAGGVPTVEFGITGNVSISGNGGIGITNTALNLVNNAYITNSVGPIRLDDADGVQEQVLPSASLVECTSALRTRRVVLSVTAADDRECRCIRLADGTSYAWRNMVSGTVGSSTACDP